MAIVPLALVRPRAGTAGSLDVPNLPRIPTQCEPYPFTWTGGIPPYTFSVISPRAPPDSVFPNIQGTSFTWRADIPATFSVSFKVEDGAGNVAQTSAVTVRRGVDSSCLNDSAESGQTTSTSSTADSPPSTTPASPTPSTTPQDPNTSSATFPLPPQSPAPSESSPNTDPRSTSISDVQSTGDARTSGATAPPLSTSLGASNTFPTPSETKSDSIQASGPSDHVSAVSTSVQSNAGSLGSLTHSHTSAIDPSFTASGDPPGSPKPSNLNPGKHSLNVGAIVGIVLGALVLVLAIVLIIRRRRKRRKARDATQRCVPTHSPPITRYPLPVYHGPHWTFRSERLARACGRVAGSVPAVRSSQTSVRPSPCPPPTLCSLKAPRAR
ncbi:hypothetical protein C8Q77DRAFT_752908 [Trametes polyzona]|nr:hypothetical protein C8Q77DRAFT_752908 [Trametes polyzona]